jgi:hypothetical protein
MSDTVWDLGGKLGNISLATRLVAVADDGEEARDPSEVMSLVDTSNGLQGKALKRYMKLRSTIGQKLADAFSEYETHRKRTQRLTDLMVAP